MEQINKLLILLTVLLIAAIIYIVVSSNNVAVSSNNVFSKTVLDMTQTTQKMMEKTMESIMENKIPPSMVGTLFNVNSLFIFGNSLLIHFLKLFKTIF